jgi:hypothetical protein
MNDVFQNLHHNQCSSYNHYTIMINEYNNLNLITYMFSEYFITFGSNHVIQRDQIFSMINFMGTLSLFFTLNLALVHHPFVSNFKWTKHQSQLIL